MMQRLVVGVLSGLVLVTAVGAQEYRVAAGEERALLADGQKAPERGGSVSGMVTAKGENWIEVKADGEEKARRYVPSWIGGAPAQGGGFDKNMLKVIAQTPVGARVKLDWKFEERPRVIKLEVLKKDEKK